MVIFATDGKKIGSQLAVRVCAEMLLDRLVTLIVVVVGEFNAEVISSCAFLPALASVCMDALA